MARLVTGGIAWFGLGVIIIETLNKWDLFGISLPALPSAGMIAAFYLFSQLILNHFEIKAGCSKSGAERYLKVRSIYLFLLFIIGFCFFISIPFLWWGVIKELAISANEGVR